MQSRSKSTLKELATELGVSVTTVSRALAGYSDVAESTRARIEAAAAAANYVPNSAGKMLVTGKSGFVGLLLPLQGDQLVDAFFGEFVSGLSEGLVERGRDLFLATAPRTQPEFKVLQHVITSGRADAMVLTRTAENDERVRFLSERGFPFITHGRVLTPLHNDGAAHDGYSWVDTDGEGAFAEAFELLYELGHRRFALLSIQEPMTFRYFREQGLENAIRQQADPNVTLDVEHVPRFDVEARAQAIARLLAGKGSQSRPTAILTLTDEHALDVLQQASRAGLNVPHDLSVIGFDNIPAAAWAPPGLTTFDQSIHDTAQQIASMLLDIIDTPVSEGQPITHQQKLLKPQLIRRGSHGPAPENQP